MTEEAGRILPESEGYRSIGAVVRDGLCHRCGVCAGVCPRGAIRFDDNATPELTPECDDCALCVKTCSGWEYSLGEKSPFGPWGRTSLCAAADQQARAASASGGFVTESLRHLLRKGVIAGALVTVPARSDPAQAEAIFAECEEDILRARQSRYSLFPWGALLGEVMKKKVPFAVVGLACQVRSLRKAMHVMPPLRHRVAMIIGIVCESNIEPDGIRHLLHVHGIAPGELEKIDFRHGSWPGVMMAYLKDGREVMLSNRNGREGAVNYLKLTYGQARCRLCTDVTCSSADISAGDPWVRSGRGEYAHGGTAGYTAVSARTERGLALVEEMIADGVLTSREEEARDLLPTQIRQVEAKRSYLAAFIRKARLEGRPHPAVGTEETASPPLSKGKFIVSNLIFTLGHTGIFRKLFLKMIFSPFGDRLTALNARRKEKAWRRRRK